MSTLTAKANWNIAKGKLKQRFAKFMRDDGRFFEGKVDELVGRIQKRAGMGAEEVKRAVQGPQKRL